MVRTSMQVVARLLVLGGLAGGSAAWGQADTPAADAGIGDIIVTAQRVQESLQKVPVAVTAFDAAQLKRSSVETVADIAIRTPGFIAGQSNAAELNLAIRGIGSGQGISQNAGGDPSVVVFVDGIYAGRGGTPDIDALDLQRIEVLRGPQGTLFGKNAIGGIVNFVSRKPDDERRFHVEMTAGNYKRLDGLARGNIALSDTTFLSAGVAVKDRGGFFLNEPTGNRNPNLSLLTGRLALRVLPSDALDITLSADWTHQDQRAQPRDNQCNPALDGGIHCAGVNPDPRITNAVIDGYVKRDLAVYRAEVEWDGPLGTLTSLTAYRTADLDMSTPFFSNPLNPPAQAESLQVDDEDDKQFSQELRLALGSPGAAFTGQVGAYYLKEKIRRFQTIDQYLPVPGRSGLVGFPQAIDARSAAIFGQFNYRPLDALTLTAGARMTWEKKSGRLGGIAITGINPIPLTTPFDVRVSKSWKAFTPRLAVEWQAADRVMVYASAARGYKSGGYQGTAATGPSAATPYDPEFAWSYEAGLKSRFADNRVQLNIAAFRTDYKDLQISQLVPFVGIVVGNAATARIKGIELEAVVRPVRGIQVDGNYTYLDAKFTNFATGATADYTGNRLPRAPKGKLNLGVQLEGDLGAWNALARADISRQAHYFFEASNVPAQRQDAYTNVDARLTLRSPDRRWSLAFWGKNLTDKLVKTYVTAFAPFQQELVPYAPPRTYGATLGFDF